MPDNKTVTFDASQYRKKPVIVTAIQLPAEGDDNLDAFLAWAEATGFENFTSERDGFMAIQTLEGVMMAQPGDWIVKGVAGEFYPCKPDIFAATYEPAAAPTPAAQSAGQEAVPVGRVQVGDGSITFIPDADAWRMGDEYEVFANAAPVNGGERELGQVIDERDQYHDAAEKLADAIAKHFGVEIGEHSNLNCPWQNALDHIAQATKRAADAQQVGAARYEKVDGCKDCRHAHYYSADRWECLKANRMFDELGRPVAAPAWCPLPALTSPAKAGGDEREAFEAWARGAYDCDGDADDGSNVLRRNGPDYVYSGVSDAWAGWQARAAPTSPAKVGGDERERFVQWYTRGTGKPISTNDRDAETAWDAWRAALSADGGEDKRDAERYRIVREMESSNFDNLSIRLPEQIDAYVDAIAANQARKGE